MVQTAKDGKDRLKQQTLSDLSSQKVERNTEINNVTKIREQGTSGSELTHMCGAKIFTVGEVSKLIKGYLEGNENFNNIWLRGEISNFTHHRSGHFYFDLKDDISVVPCVMFRNANQHLKFKPEHGMRILANGSISIYLPHGKYQFILTELLPDGLGALHLAYLQLKDKLSKEGMFALEHKLPIPKFPRVLGVVTSPTGAAVRDIIRVVTRRFPGIQILISPSRVQGEGAAQELVKAINRLQKFGGVDLIILGRGGGSLEDLWPFNEEVLARSIYDATIPIISAVGHETDFTIADFVADMRAATPSEAAEKAVPDIIELSQAISRNINLIKQYIETQVRNYRKHLLRLMESPAFTRPTDRITQNRQYLDTIVNTLSKSMIHYYELKRSKLDAGIGKLTTLNPTAILDRGYSMTLKLPENDLISSIDSIEPKDKVRLILKDGTMKCEVEEKKKNRA